MNRKLLLIVSLFTITSCVLIGCSRKIDKTESNDKNTEIKIDKTEEDLLLSKFIPDGNYKVTFTGSDMANELLFLTGDGTSYKTIGVSGKGYYLDVFQLIDNELCFKYNIDIENIDNIKSLEDINSLIDNDVMNGDKIIILRANPTKLDSFKIIEKGTNLKLSSIQLEGDYIKVLESRPSNDGDIVVETYYSQGLGVVKYEVMYDEAVMEFSELVKYEKLEN